MPYIEINDSTMFRLIGEWGDEIRTTDTMEKLTMKCIKMLSEFDGVDWTPIKKIVDKQHKRQIEENTY